MKPRFPYTQDSYVTTQKFKPNIHGGHDIEPRNSNNHPWPAPCYPVLPGRTMVAQNTDRIRGKGIRVRTILWPHIIEYLKSKGVFPQNQIEGWIDILYWHFLDVTDLDTYINQNVPVGITGNTGYVTSGGIEVDDSLKGVPPYPALHLHIEMTLGTGNTRHAQTDSYGRIDPQLIFDYKPKYMSNVQLVKKAGEYGFYIPVINGNALISEALHYGITIPTNVDGSVDFANLETLLAGRVVAL